MPFNSISPSGPVEFQPKTTSDGGPCNRFWANGWNSFLNQKLAVSHTFTSNSILLTQSELIFYSKCLIVLSDSIYNDYSRARNKEVIKVFNYSKHWRPLGILMGCFNTPSVLWDFLRRRHFSPTLSGVSARIWVKTHWLEFLVRRPVSEISRQLPPVNKLQVCEPLWNLKLRSGRHFWNYEGSYGKEGYSSTSTSNPLTQSCVLYEANSQCNKTNHKHVNRLGRQLCNYEDLYGILFKQEDPAWKSAQSCKHNGL